jgi:hypothetical protein
MLLGLWGDQDALEDIAIDTQKSLRETRDRQVLEGAIAAFSAAEERTPQDTEELLNSSLLTDSSACGGRDFDLLRRCSLEEGELVCDETSEPGIDAAGSRAEYRGLEIRYLEPCVTPNDLRYRIALDANPDATRQLASLIQDVQAGSQSPEMSVELRDSLLSTIKYAGEVLEASGVQATSEAIAALEVFAETVETATQEGLQTPLAQDWIETTRSIGGALSQTSPAEEVLLGNRYRLASVLVDETLWVASGQEQIESLIDLRADRRAENAFAVGSHRSHEKLRLFANVPSLIEHGLLSGESELQENTERFLLDFRHHHEIVASLERLRWGRGLKITVEAKGPVKRSAR